MSEEVKNYEVDEDQREETDVEVYHKKRPTAFGWGIIALGVGGLIAGGVALAGKIFKNKDNGEVDEDLDETDFREEVDEIEVTEVTSDESEEDK